MKVRILVFAAVMACAFAQLNAANYFMSPNGNDSYAGTHASPWASLQHAQGILVAGDTLFVMGGIYTSEQTWTGGNSGTALHPIVIKAYGDAVADFQTAYAPYPTFFRWEGGNHNDHLILDGESHLKHAPYPSVTRFIKFTGNCPQGSMAFFAPGVPFYGLVIRGTEWDGRNSGAGTWIMALEQADSFVVENNYIHDGGIPTGSIPPGNNTNEMQMSGNCLVIRGCSYGVIANNTFERGNHDLILMLPLKYGDYRPTQYIKVQNNTLNIEWGSGICGGMGTQHCLYEGNVFLHAGETTTYSKGALQIGGSYNTVRKNVFYNPHNYALSFESQSDMGFYPVASNNYIYNNTFLHTDAPHICMMARNDYTPPLPAAAGCAVKNNKFFNNILLKAHDYNRDGNHTTAAIMAFLVETNFDNNWVTPDVTGNYPSTTHWGGNVFSHNLIRNDARGIARDSLVMYCPDSHLGMSYTQDGSILHQGIGRIPRMQNLSIDPSGAWSGNIGGDPKLASESPDTYGSGWWYLQPGSACIDSGIVVVDSNGIWMRANAAGYSWSDLSHVGSAPDIGAYEFNGENPSPLSAPPLSSFPTKRR